VRRQSLELNHDARGLHYRFDRSEIDHLEWDFVRYRGVPIRVPKYLQIYLKGSKKPRIAFRSLPGATLRDALDHHGWEMNT
jgi:hypothetical protein